MKAKSSWWAIKCDWIYQYPEENLGFILILNVQALKARRIEDDEGKAVFILGEKDAKFVQGSLLSDHQDLEAIRSRRGEVIQLAIKRLREGLPTLDPKELEDAVLHAIDSKEFNLAEIKHITKTK